MLQFTLQNILSNGRRQIKQEKQEEKKKIFFEITDITQWP